MPRSKAISLGKRLSEASGVSVRDQVRLDGPKQLITLLGILNDVAADVDELIVELNLAGVSWAEIGRMIGITRQAARQRFQPLVDDWVAENGPLMPWDVRQIEHDMTVTDEHGNPLP
jgi:hypothetical protein